MRMTKLTLSAARYAGFGTSDRELIPNIPRPRQQARRALKRKRKFTSKSMRTSNGLAVECVAAAATVDVVAVVVVPGDPVLMARSEIYALTTRQTSPPCRKLAR